MCTGNLESLRGQTMALTGKVSLRGQHVKRKVLAEVIQAAGAAYKPDASNKVSVVVHGDLSGQHVVNEWQEFSKKLEFVRAALSRGQHICVITSSGLSDVLDGTPATCQTSNFERLISGWGT